MYPFQNPELPLEERVANLLETLTVEEKIGFLSVCQQAVPRLNIPAYTVSGEGAHGVVDREGGRIATVFPQPYGLSMTWDKKLMREIGGTVADEARAINDKTGEFLSLWFPTIDMCRDPRWGRNEEAYGEDPHLAGKLAAELIRGAAGDDPFYIKLSTAPKHFYANNYEFGRGTADSVIPEKLKNEYYLRVFEYAFREGGAHSLMTAYNKVNGIPGMLNPELNTLLREKWGCDGYFVCDGGAFSQIKDMHGYTENHTQTLALALKAGLDCFIDRDDELIRQSARDALAQGLIEEADIDRALTHIFRIRIRLGQFDDACPYKNMGKLCTDDAKALAKRAALESVVMLKNDGILPVARGGVEKIAIIGRLGAENMSDWYAGNPAYEITPLEGIKEAFPDADIVYHDGCCHCGLYHSGFGKWLRVRPDGDITADADESNRTVFRVVDWGYGGHGLQNPITGLYVTTTHDGYMRCDADRLWGWFTRPLFFIKDGKFLPEIKFGDNIYGKPYGEGARERVNGILENLKMVTVTDGVKLAADAARDADLAVVCAGNHTLIGARECIDRDTLELPEYYRELLAAVTKANKNTVFCLLSGYPYGIAEEEKSVRAVLHTAHGTQEIGYALASVISGKFNPSGRLTQTWYPDSSYLPDINDYDIQKNRVTYLYNEREVIHPFGFGLSYTNFTYSDYAVSRGKNGLTLYINVKNAGVIDGAEVVQIYARKLGESDEPLRRLVAFDRVFLKAGQSKTVSLNIAAEEFWSGGEYALAAGKNCAEYHGEVVVSL